MALLLSYLPIQSFNAAFDLSLGLVPIAVLAIRRGTKPAMISGLLWSIMILFVGKGFVVSPVQAILEYPIAFSMAGLFGLYAKKIQEKLMNKKTPSVCLMAMALTGTFARWFFHFLAGATFWGSYTPASINPWLFSFITNGGSFLANAVYVFLVIEILLKTAPKIFTVKR